MRKAFVIAIVSFLVLLALSESGILNSILFFILVGAIPGTSYAVPAGLMLLIIALCSWLIVVRLATFAISLHRLTKRHIAANKHLPRRHYSRI